MKEKVKKISKKILIKIFGMCIISLIVYLMVTSEIDKAQYLNSIDYQVTVNKNGSMTVVETWDIYAKNTNTLFKTFTLNQSKYSSITDVTVKEVKNGSYTDFKQIDEYMYHVTKNCYYALNTSSREFEIAWGAGLDNKSERKVYQITYTVNDVVTDYNDCQEIYWSFLAKGENEIPAKKVTGAVTLPQDVSNIDNLRVWGHGQLNGEINKINERQIEFNLENLSAGSMLEIRVVTEDKMFNVANTRKLKSYNYLSSIINEESTWADDANNEAQFYKNVKIVLAIIYILIVIHYLRKIKKCKEMNNGEEFVPTEIEYYRDIPRGNNSTPAEALYLYKFDKKRLNTESIQQNAVSATILDLCLKKKISLKIDNNEEIYVKIIDTPEGLKDDELAIYNLLKNVEKQKEFNLNDLNVYARKRYNEYSNSINKLVNKARESLYRIGLIDKAQEKFYNKCVGAESKFSAIKNIYMWLIVNNLIMLIPSFKVKIIAMFGISFLSSMGLFLLGIFPLVCMKLYSLDLQSRLKNKIAVLTQQGSEEKAQWNGLAKYMNDYSLLNEREVPELAIWEKYLVYATAFGIADKVIEQMKATYPEVFVVEKWEDEQTIEQYPVLDFMIGQSFRYHITLDNYNPINRVYTGTSRAYSTAKTEIAKHSESSGSGGGGGFSGGGGGRRWPVAGMGGR